MKKALPLFKVSFCYGILDDNRKVIDLCSHKNVNNMYVLC